MCFTNHVAISSELVHYATASSLSAGQNLLLWQKQQNLPTGSLKHASKNVIKHPFYIDMLQVS